MTMKKAQDGQAKNASRRPGNEHEMPESHIAGPQHAAFSKEEVHAASLLHAPHGDGSAPARARKMAALQHRMGNARLSRLLGEAGVPETAGVEAEEIPKRE
jgi:hypothetical protein